VEVAVARPKFSVQHFVACLNAPWEGVAGAHTLRTLEGVGYRYPVAPFEESPFDRDFWLYARLFRVNNGDGERRFGVRVVWLDAPGGERVVQWRWLGFVRFSDQHPVQSPAWRTGRLQLPGLGRYQFRLYVLSRAEWGRPMRRRVATEHIVLERGP
jgi:hypothetical protein